MRPKRQRRLAAAFRDLSGPREHRAALLCLDPNAPFTGLNRYLLAATIILVAAYFAVAEYFPVALQRALDLLLDFHPFSQSSGTVAVLLDRGAIWLLLFFVLLPVAMTMALIWKIKE